MGVLVMIIFPRLLTYLVKQNASALNILLLNDGAQIILSVLLGSGFISIQLLLNSYVSRLADSGTQLALANSMLVSTQALVRALSPLVNGALFTIGLESEVALPNSFITRALPFDSLALIGCIACIVCAVSFERRT